MRDWYLWQVKSERWHRRLGALVAGGRLAWQRWVAARLGWTRQPLSHAAAFDRLAPLAEAANALSWLLPEAPPFATTFAQPAPEAA